MARWSYRKPSITDLKGDACVCCKSKENLEWDHIIPRSRRGGNGLENLQLLCRRCNFSKSTGEHCIINHKLDVMLENGEMGQIDSEGHEVTKLPQMRSKVRKTLYPKSGNPQVNWRVADDVKCEIEEEARRRGIGAGELIRELWRGQHAEIMKMLQEILLSVRSQNVKIESTHTKIAAPAPEPVSPVPPPRTYKPVQLTRPTRWQNIMAWWKE